MSYLLLLFNDDCVHPITRKGLSERLRSRICFFLCEVLPSEPHFLEVDSMVVHAFLLGVILSSSAMAYEDKALVESLRSYHGMGESVKQVEQALVFRGFKLVSHQIEDRPKIPGLETLNPFTVTLRYSREPEHAVESKTHAEIVADGDYIRDRFDGKLCAGVEKLSVVHSFEKK